MFITGAEIGKDKTIPQLKKEGFEAFFIAIGAQKSRLLGLEGEEAKGIYTGVDFLRQVNSGHPPKMPGKTVVIGGGNVAIDAARCAVRTDSQQVDMFCLESRSKMPALEEEIEEALEEGININNSWGPSRILTKDGKVTGVEFVKCVSVFDSTGKFSPKFDETRKMTVEADNVLVTIGQGIHWDGLLEGTEVKLNPNGTVQADPVTFQTADPVIFAGGDALTGPKFAIDTIAVGKEGAISIHRAVHPGQSLVLGRTIRDYKPLDKKNLDLAGYDRMPRQRPLQNTAHTGDASFQDPRVTQIDTLVLQTGELSSIIPRYVEQCFPAAVDGTLLGRDEA